MERFGLVLSLVLLLGCGSEDDGDFVVEPTLSAIQTEIFDASCGFSTCHGVTGNKGDLILADGMSHGELVGVDVDNPAAAAMGMKRVIAGAPEDSFLILKLTKPVDTDFGELMPQGAVDGIDPPAKVDAIAEWIRRGALDD